MTQQSDALIVANYATWAGDLAFAVEALEVAAQRLPDDRYPSTYMFSMLANEQLRALGGLTDSQMHLFADGDEQRRAERTFRGKIANAVVTRFEEYRAKMRLYPNSPENSNRIRKNCLQRYSDLMVDARLAAALGTDLVSDPDGEVPEWREILGGSLITVRVSDLGLVEASSVLLPGDIRVLVELFTGLQELFAHLDNPNKRTD
ncbi:MAG: hypothetical protein OJJ21_22055 [Ferrovibrio sp.]|uniref:hypothetical protein n=1 Tax=Ferrovibrio sp. TaxID=1917215 RepID=UPI0026092C7F|nr:hypothetical protein [Ferrovibrio sp.]MCW0236297.1 hypothetical protein [Ferrovibrio sp.]